MHHAHSHLGIELGTSRPSIPTYINSVLHVYRTVACRVLALIVDPEAVTLQLSPYSTCFH